MTNQVGLRSRRDWPRTLSQTLNGANVYEFLFRVKICLPDSYEMQKFDGRLKVFVFLTYKKSAGTRDYSQDWISFREGIHIYIYIMGVSKNRGIPKSSILIGFTIINHPFWGFPPIFGLTQSNCQLNVQPKNASTTLFDPPR